MASGGDHTGRIDDADRDFAIDPELDPKSPATDTSRVLRHTTQTSLYPNRQHNQQQPNPTTLQNHHHQEQREQPQQQPYLRATRGRESDQYTTITGDEPMLDEASTEEIPSKGSRRGSEAPREDAESAELRRLAVSALSDSIEVLAARTRNEENTSNAEKSRQVFGMNWLLRACEEQTDTAIPRNKIYARYVSLCAAERVKPLNPATFGKLVRFAFPAIRTRRLGVRGQSKYHYCGIRLISDSFTPSRPDSRDALIEDEGMDESHILQDSSWVAALANSKLAFDEKTPQSKHIANGGFDLLNVEPYLPPQIESDTWETLFALYQSHCNSLIEAIRYMRLKQFLSLIGSFHGTLTAPVQNLLSSESIAPWIRKADHSMYKVVPQSVLHALRSLEQSLPEQVRSAYASHPSYLLQAKLGPVIDFSRLLGRLLRVNATAHAAAKFLSNPADCALMLRDWSHYLDARRLVLRELPCGADRAIEIIENEIPALLSYSSTEMYNNHMRSQSSPTTTTGNTGDLNSIAAARRAEDRIEASIVDSGVSLSNSQSQQYVNMGEGGHIPTAIEGAIDRWAGYLQAMPSQFPLCPPRVFLWAMGAVETAVLREITVSGGEAFGLLWVVRCWVDEWMAWLAERGGFLAASGISQQVQTQQYGPQP